MLLLRALYLEKGIDIILFIIKVNKYYLIYCIIWRRFEIYIFIYCAPRLRDRNYSRESI